MSWFSNLFGSKTHEDVGDRVLTAYYMAAYEFDGFREKYPNYDLFVIWAERATTLRKDIGELIANTQLTNSEDSAVSRVQDLAFKSMGQAAQGDIIRAAGGSGDSINWSVLVPEVTADVATGIVEEASELAQNVGSGVVGTLNLVKYLPWIALGAGAIAVYAYSGGFKVKSNPCHGKKKSKKRKKNPSGRRVKIYYQTVSEESSKHGDFEDQGEADVWNYDEDATIERIIDDLKDVGPLQPSSSSFHHNIWYSTVDAEENYKTGDKTYYTYHPVGFSELEERQIYHGIMR